MPDQPQHDDPYTEPANSTVDDWHGQDVQRDTDLAEEAMRRADGDERVAEEIFDAEQPAHRSAEHNVPAEQREGGARGADS